MDTHSQVAHIYNLLVSGGTITSLDAMLNHHIGRLASRICDLRNDYDVPIAFKWEPNSDGKGRHIRYAMKKKNIAVLEAVPLRCVYEHKNELDYGEEVDA